MLRHSACLFMAAVCSASLSAKTTAWQGPDGAIWNVQGNWDNGIPASGDTVVVSGSSVNDITGLTLASLQFTGASAEVSGEELTLAAGNNSLSFADSGTYIVALPLCLSAGDNRINLGTGTTVTFNGVISGAGRPCFLGKNTYEDSIAKQWNRTLVWKSVVNLNAVNTFTGGFSTQDVTHYLAHVASLGAEWTDVSYDGFGPLVFKEGGDVNYHFTSLDRRPWFEIDVTSIAFNGNISNLTHNSEITFLYYNASKFLTIEMNGDLVYPRGSIQGGCGNGHLNFRRPIRVANVHGNSGAYGGRHYYDLHAPSNEIGTVRNSMNSTVTCHVRDALHPTTTFDFTKYANGTTIDLNGYDQTADRILEGVVAASSSRVFTSATLAELKLKATADSKTYCSFSGGASLAWMPAGAKTLTLTNSVFTTTGTVTVANGKLELQAGCTCNPLMSVVLANSSSLDISGGQTLTVRALTVGGVPQWPDTYDFGIGRLQVTDVDPKAVVWTGAGATTSAADAANWGGSVPTSGMAFMPSFAESGAAAAFSEDAVYAGLAFDGSVQTFSLVGAGALTLNHCGVAVGAGHAARIENAIAFSEKAQDVYVAEGASLETAAAVSSSASVRKTGPGEWRVGADGSIDGLLSLTLAGGVLSFAAGDVTHTMPSLTLAEPSRIVLGAGATLTLAAIAQTQDETLDIVADSFANVVSPSLRGSPGPKWLTVNGLCVSFDADGVAHEYDYSDGLDIDAHGGVVVDTNGVVRVAENGSGADGVSLSGSNVSVGVLAQAAEDDAVVSLDGGTLTAGTLARLAGSGALVVGSTVGDGALTAKDGSLVLENRDTAADLVIRSDLAPAGAAITKTRAGTAVLPGSRSWSVTATIEDGSLAFSESKPRVELSRDGDAPTVQLGSNGSELSVGNLSGSLSVAGGGSQQISHLAVSGGKVTVGGGVCLQITNIAERVPVAGELVVTNATLALFNPESPIVLAKEPYLQRAIHPGSGGDGLLRVCAGATITNKLILGSKDHVGAAYFEGGDSTLVAGDANIDPAGYTILANGGNAQGYLEVREGAKVTQAHSSRFSYGGANNATLAVLGGTYVATNYPGYGVGSSYWVFANGSGIANLFVRGGSFRSLSKGQMLDQGTGEGVMTVTDDGTICFDNSVQMGYGKSPDNTRGTKFNLLNGGRLIVQTINSNSSLFPSGATNAVGERVARPVYVNFNGGEVSHLNGDNFLLFGENYSGYNCISRVTVYEGGATFRGNRLTVFPFPFSAPTGGGVKSVPWMSQSGFIAPPSVRIDGDGYGATAYAEFDSRSGSVTNILITSPGCDYTHATAVLLMGSTVLQEIPCEVSPNAKTGAMRFRGTAASHVLARTWGEWTVGEVLLDNPSAALTVTQRGNDVLSTNTVLTLAEAGNTYTAWDKVGGNNTRYRLQANCVRGTAGKVTGATDGLVHAQRLALEGAGSIDFDGLVYRVEGTWEVDVADLIARRDAGAAVGQYDCSVVFADDARIVIRNAGRLEELEGRTRLFRTVGAGHVVTPSAHLLDDAGLPQGWNLSVGEHGVSIGRETGAMIIIF